MAVHLSGKSQRRSVNTFRLKQDNYSGLLSEDAFGKIKEVKQEITVKAPKNERAAINMTVYSRFCDGKERIYLR